MPRLSRDPVDDPSPPLDVLCEDGPVIAVNKPPGVIVQGAPHGVDSLADHVRRYLREKYDKPGNVYLGVPHRLDRPVSGVVVFSRNSKCAARLSEQFAKRQVTKVYRALLDVAPEPDEGTLTDWLLRLPEEEGNSNEPKVRVVPAETAEAKEARLSYRTLARGSKRALVEIDLQTGRMHQIRVQFASRGWPIVGDVQYGGPAWPSVTASSRGSTRESDWRTRPIALHAWQLTIQHPIRYDPLTITAPLPATWKSLGIDLADAASV